MSPTTTTCTTNPSELHQLDLLLCDLVVGEVGGRILCDDDFAARAARCLQGSPLLQHLQADEDVREKLLLTAADFMKLAETVEDTPCDRS